jgi:hypothetical protein
MVSGLKVFSGFLTRAWRGVHGGVVLAVALGALASTGCSVRYHAYGGGYGYGPHYRTAWGYGGASTSYGTTGIVWNQPTPAPAPAPRPAPARAGEVLVRGSDGTLGWQRAGNADVEIHRLSAAMTRQGTGCQVTTYQYDETRGTCSGTPVLLRRDATNVYRLCGPGVDEGTCAAAWAPVLAAQ